MGRNRCAEFVDLVISGGPTCDHYLAADDEMLSSLETMAMSPG
ncbi:MAG: hypothetical protein ACT6S0_20230 [Roseateles sp.]